MAWMGGFIAETEADAIRKVSESGEKAGSFNRETGEIREKRREF
jgi:hypothetical protein